MGSLLPSYCLLLFNRTLLTPCCHIVSRRFTASSPKAFYSTGLAALLALQCFLSFNADDWNRSKRGDGVYPSDMKHSIEDQTGKGYTCKVRTGCRLYRVGGEGRVTSRFSGSSLC